MKYTKVINQRVLSKNKSALFLQVNESAKTISIEVQSADHVSYDIVKVWLAYFSCWVCYNINSVSNANLFVRKKTFTESEFRCLCRIAIWHLPNKKE